MIGIDQRIASTMVKVMRLRTGAFFYPPLTHAL